MEETRSRSGLFRSMLMIATAPIFIFALVIIAFSSGRFTNAIHEEVKHGLKSMGTTLLMIYDDMYPGDYQLIEKESGKGTELTVMKGDHRLNEDYDIIDRLKEQTGLDFTVFYADTRVITTIKNRSGERIIATGANARVLEDVLYNEKGAFYSDVDINDESYFAYYAPVFNLDGSCVGMVFVGKPTAQVNESVRNCLIPIFVIAIIGMIIAGLAAYAYSRRLTASIKKLESFLGKVGQGDFTARLENGVLDRRDEVGKSGRYAVSIQKSLRELTSLDSLTLMYNRNYGEKKLRRVQQNSESSGQPFTLAIGNIDFFKKVNNTYGHDCGDMVLKNVALLLKKHMAGNGFAVKWGGEEFLIVYEKSGIAEAEQKLNNLLNELRTAKVQYGEDVIGITMTFGMTEGNAEDLDAMLREADERLYKGKVNGKDQVVAK